MTNTSSRVKRTYDSPLRQSQARATRRRIIEAASRLFADRGYAATSIEHIAEEAGVSRPTVFTSVGGKPSLLKAAWDVGVVGDDEPVALADRPRSREIMAEPDPRVFLSRYVELTIESAARVAGILEAARAARKDDPAVAILYEEMQAGRNMGAMHVVDLLIEKGGLRAGLSRDRAIDILYTLLEPATFRSLVVERGWPVERYTVWLSELLQGQLLQLPQ